MSAVTFHLAETSVRGSGTFVVKRGRGLLPGLLAAVLHLPPTGIARVRIEIDRRGDREMWRRWFGETPYSTEQIRRGRQRIERVGRLELRYRLAASARAIRYVHERTALRLGHLTIPLAPWLSPKVTARAWNSRREGFFVAVSVWAPVAGPLLSYAGYLEEEG